MSSFQTAGWASSNLFSASKMSPDSWTRSSCAVICLSVGAIVVWAALGPRYHYSDTWQLIINTGTTIVTFLMVFLIQNTQNRDARAIHLKLDEVIRAIGSARNELIDIEKLSDAELEQLAKRYEIVRRETEGRRRSKRPKSA